MTTLEKPSFTLPKAPGAIINGVVGRNDTDSGRFYVRPTDELALHSVTHVLDATSDLGFLKNWYAKLAGNWVVENLDTIADEFIASGTDILAKKVAEGVRKLSEIKADIGSYQHWVLEALILDQPIPEIPEHLVDIEVDGEACDHDAISDGLLNFFTDFPDAIVHMAEATVANPALGYAGTLDLIVEFPNGITIDGVTYRFLIIDLKTGKHLKPDMRAQLGAYRYATEVWLDSLGNIAPMLETDGAAVLHLRKDYENGYKLIIVDAGPNEFEWFAQRAALFAKSADQPKRLGSIAYPPLPDGSQPLPLIEDIDDFSRFRNKLRAAGLRRLSDLSEFSDSDLSSLDGIGPKTVQACEAKLAEYGLHFAVKAGAA